MSKFQISFVFDKDTDKVSGLTATKIGSVTAPVTKVSVADPNAKVELKGSSLILNDDILNAVGAKVDSKLVLTIEDNVILLINPKLEPAVKGGNKVTGKNTISCRGKVKDDLEAIGSIFTFKIVANGVIELIPVTATTDVPVSDETQETDDVISEEDINALYNDDEEQIADDLTFDL